MFEIIGTKYSASFRTTTNGFFVRVWAAAARHDPHHGRSECCRLRRRARCVHRRLRPSFPSTTFEVTSSKLPSSSSPGTGKGGADTGYDRCAHQQPRHGVPSAAAGVALSSTSPGRSDDVKGGTDAGCGGAAAASVGDRVPSAAVGVTSCVLPRNWRRRKMRDGCWLRRRGRCVHRRRPLGGGRSGVVVVLLPRT